MRAPLLLVLGLAAASACSDAPPPGLADGGSDAAPLGDARPDVAVAPDALVDGGAADGTPDALPLDASLLPTCGNGRLDPQEGCDGDLFPEGLSTCDDNWLGNGTTTCTNRCTLDVYGCDSRDYCAGNGFYADDECDACELMYGHADPACAAHCGADGVCASWYDPAVGAWSCEATGFGPDPDCGACGNGVAEGHEKCDGDDYAVFQNIVLDSCEVWGFEGGTLTCLPSCLPNFTGCY